MVMILAFDSSSAACTAALFDETGACVAAADEVIGRGHSERLVPMIGDLLAGRRVTSILVGAGPGSFTGIRVAVAAAHGLAIGWGAAVHGVSSLALLAAAAGRAGPVAAVVAGGHGELFAQEYDGATLRPLGAMLNGPAEAAAALVGAPLLVGSGAAALVAARGSGEAIAAWPSARSALRLPSELRSLAPRPLYARAPDARPKAA